MINTIILDKFQTKAISAIDNNQNVLITAPTGSGKTLPAEHAITKFCKQGKKVIYTSPIKAYQIKSSMIFLKNSQTYHSDSSQEIIQIT